MLKKMMTCFEPTLVSNVSILLLVFIKHTNTTRLPTYDDRDEATDLILAGAIPVWEKTIRSRLCQRCDADCDMRSIGRPNIMQRTLVWELRLLWHLE